MTKITLEEFAEEFILADEVELTREERIENHIDRITSPEGAKEIIKGLAFVDFAKDKVKENAGKTVFTRTIMDKNAPNRSTGIVNGESSNILNWDDVRYSWAFPKYKQMVSNFWTPLT